MPSAAAVREASDLEPDLVGLDPADLVALLTPISASAAHIANQSTTYGRSGWIPAMRTAALDMALGLDDLVAIVTAWEATPRDQRPRMQALWYARDRSGPVDGLPWVRARLGLDGSKPDMMGSIDASAEAEAELVAATTFTIPAPLRVVGGAS